MSELYQILSLLFSSPMQSDNVDYVAFPNYAQSQPNHSQFEYDFTGCQRVKKLTTHDIFRFKQNGVSLIAKLYATDKLCNYQQQVKYLDQMNSNNILKILYHRSSLGMNLDSQLERSHLIVVKQAIRGDLNDYLPKYGKMNEKMARTYFKKLIETLNSIDNLNPPIIHPNLAPVNILLDEEGELFICGWSEQNSKSVTTQRQEAVFACGEILICLMTSFMPFYKKYSSTDTFFKFINPQNIHKFWNQITKKMMKMDKSFEFSKELKQLVENIFLKRYLKFSDILSSPWVSKQTYTQSELKEILEKKEQIKNQKIAAKKKIQLENEQRRKKIIHAFQLACDLNRSAEVQDKLFIKDYEQNLIKQQEIPNAEDVSGIKIDGVTPNFIIASIKDFLRRQNGTCSVILYEQYVLHEFKVIKKDNYIMISLDFQLPFEEDDQPFHPELISIELKISFVKSKNQTYAITQTISSSFNSYYTNLAIKAIEQKILTKRERSSEVKVEVT